MMSPSLKNLASLALCALLLQACSDDSGSGYYLGGTVSGLTGGQLVLQNNVNSRTVTITANGDFRFDGTLGVMVLLIG